MFLHSHMELTQVVFLLLLVGEVSTEIVSATWTVRDTLTLFDEFGFDVGATLSLSVCQLEPKGDLFPFWFFSVNISSQNQ